MGSEQLKTDEQLAKETQRGNTNAFGFLVERYEEKIKRYVKKFIQTAEFQDICQNVFLKTFANIKSFNTSQKFSPWIFRIAHNELVNYLKKKKTLPLFDFDVFLPHFHTNQKEIENEVEKKFLLEHFEQCLNKLEAKYKEIIIFYYQENLSYQEISQITRLPLGTIAIRLKRAKQKLKQICNKTT